MGGELAVARKKKLKRSVKSAMRKVPMDASLKRPLSGYMLWFKDTRKNIKGKNIAKDEKLKAKKAAKKEKAKAKAAAKKEKVKALKAKAKAKAVAKKAAKTAKKEKA